MENKKLNYLVIMPRLVQNIGDGYSFPLGIAYISAVLKKAGFNVWSYFGTGTPVICAVEKDSKKPPFTLFLLKRSVEVPARNYFLLDETDMKILRLTVQERIRR